MRIAVSTVATVLALCLVASFAAAQSSSCTCLNDGIRKVSDDLPERCECTCSDDWQPPRCEYKSTEKMGILYTFENSTENPYKSTGVKIKSLLAHFGYPKSSTGIMSLNRRLIESEPENKTLILALMSVDSTQADRFARDFEKLTSADPYYKSIACLDARLYEPPQSSPSELAQSVMISGLIPWAAISWIVGTLIMLICFPILECILGSVCSGSTFCAE